jgi:hypothetical protein
MNELINFNPEQSAEKIKNLWNQRQAISLEIVSELYKAKEFYSGKGSNQHSKKGNELIIGTYNQLITFKDYLEYIGLYQGKVYQWFDRYIPQENKLLSWKEFQEKKQIEIESKKSDEQKKIELRKKEMIEEIKEFEDLYKVDYQYEYEDIQKQNRWISFKRTKDFIRNEKEKNNSKEPSLSNKINDLLDGIQENEHIKESIKSKIGMTINDESKFIEALQEYLDTLDSDNIKLEALHNIIKFCKLKINEYQKKSINK